MPNRVRTSRQRPPKPYETFPLFPHAKGYWCKKVDGDQRAFGPWEWPEPAAYERSWRAALDAWHKFEEDRAHGRVLRARPDLLTMGTLVDAYMTHQLAEKRAGSIGARHFSECLEVAKGFRDQVGRELRVSQLEQLPEVIFAFRAALDERLGWHRFNKWQAILVAMFNWAEDPLRGVLDRPFRLKKLFEKKTEKLLRRAKRLKAADEGKQLWTPAELRALLGHPAPPAVTAFMLLGYYAAFGNTDCADLPRSAIQFKPERALGLPDDWATIHFPRPKTEVERAAVIPPAVVAAMHAATAMAREPAQPQWRNLIFLTRFGFPFVRDEVHTDDQGVITKVVPIDSVGLVFSRYRDRITICPAPCGLASAIDARGEGQTAAHCVVCRKPLAAFRKLGFYTFRHTAITYAGGSTDLDALHRWRGHVLPGMSRVYVEDVEVHKLKSIADRLTQKRQA